MVGEHKWLEKRILIEDEREFFVRKQNTGGEEDGFMVRDQVNHIMLFSWFSFPVFEECVIYMTNKL